MDKASTAPAVTQPEVTANEEAVISSLSKTMAGLSVASSSAAVTSPSATTTTVSVKPSVLQRPWADRLLAAARTQQGDNAQVCSST